MPERGSPGTAVGAAYSRDFGRGLDQASRLGPEGVIARLRAANRARGRGGEPFLEAWERCRAAEAGEKSVVGSAVDRDPRSRVAEVLLERDPYAVLEGLLIAARVVGAARCYLCVGADRAGKSSALREALDRLGKGDLTGPEETLHGSTAAVVVVEIPAPFVEGEDTALLKAIEGRQPQPELRASDALVHSLHRQPALLESAETLAKVAAALRDEGAAAAGEDRGEGRNEELWSKRLVTLSGDLVNGCTVEVAPGTTIAALLEGPAGISPGLAAVQAVQIGGPTGPLLGAVQLDTPLDCELLAGAGLGSGSIAVFGSEERCAVELVRELVAYVRERSCGKCAFCREGTRQLAGLLDKIAGNEASAEDLDLLVELSRAMETGSICDVGRTASRPVLTSLELFRDDYQAHVRDRRCHGFQVTGRGQ